MSEYLINCQKRNVDCHPLQLNQNLNDKCLDEKFDHVKICLTLSLLATKILATSSAFFLVKFDSKIHLQYFHC